MKNKLNISQNSKNIIAKLYNINSPNAILQQTQNLINSLCTDNSIPQLNNNNILFGVLAPSEKGRFIKENLKESNTMVFNNIFLDSNPNNNFQLQGNSLEQNQRFLKYCLILNILHEFRHYQQYCLNKDKNNEIINGLNIPLSETPLYLFQEHELDAFKTSFDVIETLEGLFDHDFLDYIEQEKNIFLTQQKEDKEKIIGSPKQLIREVRPFYEDYLTLQDFESGKNLENIQADNIRFNLNNQSYSLNLYKIENNKFLCKLINKSAANSSIYFKISSNQLSILNFTQNLNQSFYDIQNDTKNNLTAATLQIVNYLKSESQLDTFKQNIVVNKIMPIESQATIKEFISSLSQIDNIKISNPFPFINKTYYVSYPIEDRIKESIKECEVINNIRSILKKIQNNTISENDININNLNKMVEIQNQRNTFDFSNISAQDIIKMFKNEMDRQISRNGDFDFSDTNIKNIFFISKLQRLRQEISINKDIINQEKILSEKGDEKPQKTKEHNKEDLNR